MGGSSGRSDRGGRPPPRSFGPTLPSGGRVALKPAPAPRVVIALTAGLPLNPEQGDLHRQLEPVTHAASDAGVEFYALSDLADDVDVRDVTPERAKAIP